MQRRAFLAATAASVGAVAGCFGTSNQALPNGPTSDWRQQAHDSRNTSASDVAVPDRGNQAWDAGDAGSIEPLVADGMVYSVGASATALDAQTGDQEWEYDFSAQTGPTPTVTENHLLIPAEQQLVALNRSDGSEEWSRALPRPAEGSLTTDSSIITLPLTARRGESGLVAFDATTGDRLWGHTTLAARTTAINDDRVYVTGYRQDGNTGVLRALSVADGSLLWETELDHPDTEPVVANGGLLVPDQGTLAVHDPADGTRVRSLGTFGDRLGTAPAVSDGTAFLGTRDQKIVAVSIEDGSTVWQQSGSATRGISVGRESIVTSGESLPEASLAGLAALDRSDGTVQWEHQIEGFDAYPSTAPVLADGAVYYTSNASSGIVALGDVPGDDDE
ncbi:PQQ-binding-like beta-propeller repeat protein [Natronomonas sp. LN261]|uniref:outer membrane protein assembly factor BamB family protein n=1 Tax=Natronomonas sp. LN261 TaxID=2750669 RepID=UPI0015EF08E7|nr:PQQ-binding-like beta-propeller repeat protein [Natronomonas sp. LN261]